MLKRGPEIKLPPLKVPAFLRDLYEDLRERHLLPLVALLVIAIVAIPLVFGGGSDGEADGAGGGADAAETAGAGGATAEASALVAKAAPGLRRYQRRLENLKAKNPFTPQYTGSGEGSRGGGSGGDGEGSGPTATTTPESSSDGGVSPEEGSSGSGSGDGSSGTTRTKRTYFSYAIDVRVTNLNGSGASGSSASGSGEATGSGIAGSSAAKAKPKPKSKVRRNLPEYTMLPSRETPALVFVGASKDEKKALFVVSSDVEAVFGDAKCVLGSQRCEMLMLEPGLPETVVYGRAGRRFRIELLEVGLVESDKINRAPLGKPKRGKKKE